MKKILISLLVWFVWFVWFWYCEDEMMYLDHVVSQDFQWYVWDTYYENVDVDMLCLKNKTCNNWQLSFSANHTWTWKWLEDWNIWWLWFCTTDWIIYYSLTSSSCSITIDWYNFHQLTSEECQNEYDLIPSSDVDTDYCVENDLCPVSTWSASWSELVINNIVHEWRPLINLSIPDYITRDYTVDENQYDIYVWSWYDQDYIDSILAINSYRPDSQDFTQIFVSWLTLIFPYIFVALLIVFMWKLLKRIFK